MRGAWAYSHDCKSSRMFRCDDAERFSQSFSEINAVADEDVETPKLQSRSVGSSLP